MVFISRNPKKTAHNREVLTHYAGELIQHDSSYHLWAPAAQEKWYLITSLDDYSRFIFYAALIKKETSWAHILALQTGHPSLWAPLLLLRRFSFDLPIGPGKGFLLAKTPTSN